MNAVLAERLGAVIAGIIVAVVSFWSLWQERNHHGVESNVFKIMLLLLGIGAVLALLAGLNILGYTPPKGA